MTDSEMLDVVCLKYRNERLREYVQTNPEYWIVIRHLYEYGTLPPLQEPQSLPSRIADLLPEYEHTKSSSIYEKQRRIEDEAMLRKSICPNRVAPACGTCSGVVTCLLGKGNFHNKPGQATPNDCLKCKIDEINKELSENP